MVAFSLFSPQFLGDDDSIMESIEQSATGPAWSGPGKLGQHQADAAYEDRLEALAGIHVPAMVMGFELDMVTPASLSQEVAKAIPECRYVEIPGSGHLGPFEKPDQVNAALLQFFAEV
jgi:O-succinylbenzoate synthase